MNHIILASKSPRRKELMTLIPVTFQVETEEVEEHVDLEVSPEENVKRLASEKAWAVARKFQDEWVLGCDTVVVYGEEILGKPKDKEDAKKMLGKLSGKAHLVYTGINLSHASKEISIQKVVCSKVYMKEVSEAELDWYIETGEPLDKAGAYGIQGYASNFIERIEGDYFNIVGLPVSAVYEMLKEEGVIRF